MLKTLNLNKAAVCLATFGACSLHAAVLAQTYEQMLEPLTVASPSGVSTVLKYYNPTGSDYHLSITSASHVSDSVPLLSGTYARDVRGSDGLVVGWIGDKHLMVGWPLGQLKIPGPGNTDGIEITYTNYDRDLTMAQPRHTDNVILHNVAYTMQEANVSGNVDCTIKISGSDGTFFDAVSIKIVGHGAGATRNEPMTGGGSVGIEFSLTRLLGSQSPPFTLTQARFGEVNFYADRDVPSHGPKQDEGSLIYSWLSIQSTVDIFRALRDGDYNAKYVLTFGEQVIVYWVHDPITAEVATAYQKCETRTNIFPRLLGVTLNRY